jgi:hypothetical protein
MKRNPSRTGAPKPSGPFEVGKIAWEFYLNQDISEPVISIPARYVMRDAVKAPDKPVDMAWDTLGQELLDAGLVARTCHADGRVTYRLTAAGKRWGAVA